MLNAFGAEAQPQTPECPELWKQWGRTCRCSKDPVWRNALGGLQLSGSWLAHVGCLPLLPPAPGQFGSCSQPGQKRMVLKQYQISKCPPEWTRDHELTARAAAAICFSLLIWSRLCCSIAGIFFSLSTGFCGSCSLSTTFTPHCSMGGEQM